MKKHIQGDPVEVERWSENGQCKYKMRVSLADEITVFRSKGNSSQHNDSRAIFDHVPIINSKSIALQRQSLCEAKKPLTRTSSKDDLKVRRMFRSSSEMMRPSALYQLSNKTDEFAYRSLLRHYQKALSETNAPKMLKDEHIARLFCAMGFLPSLVTKEDEAIISTIRYMLCSAGRRGVSHSNMFEFLLIICGISLDCHSKEENPFGDNSAASALSKEPEQALDRPLVVIQVGLFDSEEKWMTSESERKQLRKIFGKLYYNKISNDEVKYKRVSEEEQPPFKPHILGYSREIAHAKRNRILRQVEQYCEIRPTNKSSIDLAELLMLDKKVKEEKNSIRLKEKENNERDGCTFHPKINRATETLKTESSHPDSVKKDRCLKLYDKSRQAKPANKHVRPTLEQQQLNQMKQCTFKPSSTKYSNRKQIKPMVRNETKLIERMKEGRELRLMNDTIKSRGYPENMNWSNFVREYKRKATGAAMITCKQSHTASHQSDKPAAPQPNTRPSEAVPLLSMDIKLHSDTFQLEVFDGDSVESLTSKILVRHELPYDRFDKIAKLIDAVIGRCEGLCVQEGVVRQVD